MKTIFKSFVALAVTALVPIVEYLSVIVLFSGLVLSSVGMNSTLNWGDFKDMFTWAALLMMFAVPVAFGYVFLVGPPTLLAGWYFRAIRWWSVLVAAFVVSVVPATLSLLSAPIGPPETPYLWQDLSVENLGFVAMTIIVMGFVGLSSGLVFWLLWRYWVSPNSPAGRPLSLSPQVKINSPDMNEIKAPDTA
ncbi:hypothetical protein ANAEL_01324 [Anaerolineales bacterium]|nr:hypothetical protein ANAEL_01324 [Anaerolineales bacterium]